MKAIVVYAALALLVLAGAQAQQLLGAGALVDVDENDLSPRAAAVLDTTRDALSPSDQQLLTDMLQESEGVQLVDQDGDSLEDEVEAEADAFVDEAIEDADEEAEDEQSESSDEDEAAAEDSDESEAEADEDAEPYIVAQEIPGTAQAVAISDADEDEQVVEAEDLNEGADEEDEALTDEDLTDIAEEGQAAASGEDAAFLQIDQADEEEEEEQEEAEDETEEEAEDETEDETEDEDEVEDEQEDEAEEQAMVESASSSLLSVPEAELHHELMSIQEPAMTFLQVVEEMDLETESEDDAENEAEAESEGETSDSADSDDVGEGWGEAESTTDPYALAQTEELLYSAEDSEDGTLVGAPLNAVTSTAETAAQIHAELDEAANMDSSSEFMVDTDTALAHADAAAAEGEAEADTDTSEEMEVDTYGEGVWQDVNADKAAVQGAKKDANGKPTKPLPDQASKGGEALKKDTADTRNAEAQTRYWAETNPKVNEKHAIWGQWNSDLLMP